jgi:membrane protein YqaA with SNARE-associated domain
MAHGWLNQPGYGTLCALSFLGDPLCMVGGMMHINFGRFSVLMASGKLLRYAVAAWIALRMAG